MLNAVLGGTDGGDRSGISSRMVFFVGEVFCTVVLDKPTPWFEAHTTEVCAFCAPPPGVINAAENCACASASWRSHLILSSFSLIAAGLMSLLEPFLPLRSAEFSRLYSSSDWLFVTLSPPAPTPPPAPPSAPSISGVPCCNSVFSWPCCRLWLTLSEPSEAIFGIFTPKPDAECSCWLR